MECPLCGAYCTCSWVNRGAPQTARSRQEIPAGGRLRDLVRECGNEPGNVEDYTGSSYTDNANHSDPYIMNSYDESYPSHHDDISNDSNGDRSYEDRSYDVRSYEDDVHGSRVQEQPHAGTRAAHSGEDEITDGITRYLAELDSPPPRRPALWRQEVASRVSSHRARRLRRSEVSLPLEFEGEAPTAESPEPRRRLVRSGQRNQWRHELVPRDPGVLETPAPEKTSAGTEVGEMLTSDDAADRVPAETFAPPLNEGTPHDTEISASMLDQAKSDVHPAVLFPDNPEIYASRGSSALKLLSFPRSENAPLVEVESLADPVESTRPRILDAPDEIRQAVVPSTLFDVRLESDDEDAVAIPDFRLPLQVASFSRRICSALVDWLVVLIATGIFAAIVQFIIGPAPQTRTFWMLALAAPAVLWSAYQYLFLAYAGYTPGMQLTQLEVTTFEGGNASPQRCRGRAAAAAISCLSAGMGFLWALMDVDHLGWHDRITRTYLRQV